MNDSELTTYENQDFWTTKENLGAQYEVLSKRNKELFPNWPNQSVRIVNFSQNDSQEND